MAQQKCHGKSKIIGTQPLCYCKNLKLVNCTMQHTDLAFEYSDVEADICGNVESIKNPKSGTITADGVGMRTIILTINDTILTAKLENNSSADALVELLKEDTVSIHMSDYGNMEKVGDLGTSLPTNNEQITTEAGDLILYMGSSLVIYYDTNTWNFTRLGKIQDVTDTDLKNILGKDDVTVPLSIMN